MASRSDILCVALLASFSASELKLIEPRGYLCKGTGGLAAGAFGAHGLRTKGYAPDRIHAWETASTYAVSPHLILSLSYPGPELYLRLQFMNGVALLVLSTHPRFSTHKFAGPAIAAGAAIFSGSIFALVLGREKCVLFLL